MFGSYIFFMLLCYYYVNVVGLNDVRSWRIYFIEQHCILHQVE